MTDVLLRQSPDGGELTIEAGLVLMAEGLETAAFLSLFGGNLDDSGDDATAHLQWWGNRTEQEPAREYRSETQYLIRALPAVPRNLRRIEQAATRDLAWMIPAGIAKSVTVSASIPDVNRVTVAVTIVTLQQQVQLTFG